MLLTSLTLGKVDNQVFSERLAKLVDDRSRKATSPLQAAPPSIARLPCDDEDRTQEPAPAGVMVAFMPDSCSASTAGTGHLCLLRHKHLTFPLRRDEVLAA
ncbi:hypothetical protein E4U51_008594 [Claviceps purpurea]|nr:hypothetical protein E4U51_008594 [Claviceps purpurea]